MYNMYGGGGYGGYGGMGMMGGGQEQMYMIVCCVCVLCIASIAIAYFAGAFCSFGLGTKCKSKESGGDGGDGGEFEPIEPVSPGPRGGGGGGGGVPGGPVDLCSESWGSTPRTGNDPRPPIRPEYCESAARVVGRDCYYWKVEADPVTGRARWMRVPDDAKGDMRTGGECSAQVTCANVIDPATLPRYSELEPTELLKQCTAVASTATNEADTVAFLTKSAAEVSPTWTDSQAWTDTHSRQWYQLMIRFVGQKDLSVYISNAVKAATTLKNKLNVQSIRKSTFAHILEAAVRSPENRADWIIDVVNIYNNQILTAAQANEGFFLAYLRGLFKDTPMIPWQTVIDNPRAMLTPAPLVWRG